MLDRHKTNHSSALNEKEKLGRRDSSINSLPSSPEVTPAATPPDSPQDNRKMLSPCSSKFLSKFLPLSLCPKEGPSNNENLPVLRASKERTSESTIQIAEKNVRSDKTQATNDSGRSTKENDSSERANFADSVSTEDAYVDADPWFHGYLPNDMAAMVLEEDGDFIVHIAVHEEQENPLLSVRHEGIVFHIPIFTYPDDSQVYVVEYVCPTITTLIQFHLANSLPVHENGALLKKGVNRPVWSVPREMVTVESIGIGTGQYGQVNKGTLNTEPGKRNKECAVKMLKHGRKVKKNKNPEVTITDKMALLHEADVMFPLDHKYVISVLGVVNIGDPIMLLVELADISLKERLRSTNPPSTARMKKYSLQILSGMAFLEENSIIHRDLAVRNILLSLRDKCKISDFGLAVRGKEFRGNRACKVPIRYLAPETICYGTFTSKSDVWSYGVTVWEIYAHAKTPYGHIKSLSEVRSEVSAGELRLKPLPGMCPSQIELMQQCFLSEKERPTFAILKKLFKSSTSIPGKILNIIRLSAEKTGESGPSGATVDEVSATQSSQSAEKSQREKRWWRRLIKS